MSVVVHITSEEQEKKYFELFYKLYPKARKPHSTGLYYYNYGRDVGFNMNNGNSFSVADWSYYQRIAKQYDYELIEFDEFLKRFEPEFKKQYRFKVGDKVRIINTNNHYHLLGTVATIKRIATGYQEISAYVVETKERCQDVEDYQLELAEPQEEIVEITELNAEQYYGRVGMIVKYHHLYPFKNDVFSKGIKIVSKSPRGNLLFLDLENNKEHILYIDRQEGVTIKFTDNFKQLNKQTIKSKEEIYEAMQAEWLRITGLKVGDYVKCTRSWEQGEQGFRYPSVISSLIGGTQQISAIDEKSIDCPEGTGFPFFVLEPVKAPEKKYELKDCTRNVLIKENGNIECGCLKLTKADAVQALKIMKDLHQIFSGYAVIVEVQGSTIDPVDITALTKLLK